MKYPTLKDLTSEQVAEVTKVVAKARKAMLIASVKFFFGLLAANFFTVAVGHYFLNGCSDSVQTDFRFLGALVNTFFMIRYLNGKFRENSDIVTSKIKEILAANS